MTALGHPQKPTTTLRRVGLADPLTAAGLRHDLGEWLRQAVTPPIPATRYADILCGVNEALANCAEHAYNKQSVPGAVTLQATYDIRRRVVRVCVADHGAWRPPRSEPDDTRGRGLALMRALADRCTIERHAEGTMICLEYDTQTG
jgi:anti-sigma regulatory factor (Ser/Thr protein kinase)